MPKAVLEFKLPEEQEEFKTAMNAVNMSLTLSEFSLFLRSKLKYEDLSESDYKIYESIREKFFEIVDNNDVEF